MQHGATREYLEDNYHQMVGVAGTIDVLDSWGGLGADRSPGYGVGAQSDRLDRGGDMDCTSGSGFYNPNCSASGKPLCGLTKMSDGLQGQAGQTAYTINITPQRADYFRSEMCRMDVRDSANEDLRRRVRFTAATVNGIRREDFDTVAPVAATNRYQTSDDYALDDPYAIAVGWGVSGSVNSNYVLGLTFFPNYAAAVLVDHAVVIWGEPLPEGHPEVLEMKART
jgi:hypothetical protein